MSSLDFSVQTFLNYVVPPSQLVLPLPPHLLSHPLRVRQHFLHPDTPNEYLCWPSPDQDRIIALLEALQFDQDSHPPYPVRYLSDDDQIFAHVAVTPDLRLVFRWDGPDGWRYHDGKLMPFPPGCHDSLRDAMLANTNTTPIDISRHPASQDPNDDEDSYWNSYGQDADERDSTDISSACLQKHGQVDSEDAYWAQYSTVQGTADSTAPSPLSRNRPKPEFRTEPLVQSSHDLISIHPESFLCSDEPSPHAIIAALNTIIPEGCHKQLSLCSLDVSGSEFTSPSPLSDLTNSTNDGPSTSPLILPKSEQGTHPPHHLQCKLDAEEALRDSIRAVYHLWRLSRAKPIWKHDAVPTDEHGDDKRLFLRIVQESIGVL